MIRSKIVRSEKANLVALFAVVIVWLRAIAAAAVVIIVAAVTIVAADYDPVRQQCACVCMCIVSRHFIDQYKIHCANSFQLIKLCNIYDIEFCLFSNAKLWRLFCFFFTTFRLCLFIFGVRLVFSLLCLCVSIPRSGTTWHSEYQCMK